MSLTSSVSKVRGSQRRGIRPGPYIPTEHERRSMATPPRSQRLMRSSTGELTTSELARQPLSVSSISSVSDIDSVIDLTNETTPAQPQSTSSRPNVLIIDSDEEVVEMDLPTPPQRTQPPRKVRTNHPNLQPSRSFGANSECIIISEPKTVSKKALETNETTKISSPSTGTSKAISCPVCMETAQQIEKNGRHLMVTRCGHVFCDVCITKAVKLMHKCPTCRKTVPRSSYHPLFLS